MRRHERRKSWGCHAQISILDNFTSDGNWSDGISLVGWNWDPKESWHACIPFPWGKVGRLHHRMQFLMKPCIQPKSSMGGAAKTCTASYCESISSHSFILLPSKITIILSYYRPSSQSSPWSSSSLSRGGARFVHRPLLCVDLFIFLHCQALLRLTPFLLRLTDPHFL